MEIEESFSGVYIIEDHIATENLKPSIKVYGEKLVDFEGKEYRIWDPRRSKLAAAILKGLKRFPFHEDSKVLYLGASAGTTPSHISDIARNSLVYCVEFSPRMMRELVDLCKVRENLIPILGDATKPKNYLNLVEKVDVLYCDVAQAKQSELFMDNMRLFLKPEGIGIITVKARSIDVTQNPKKIFREEESKLKTGGFRVLERVKLEPYEKDHMAFVCEFAF
ncbi:fibrillarin-like rRNA/tRNA 2'-O-methyltransferase [Methanobacterium aggregans]|uniref:fibrillarin-like rRNA/tRNA 2'-O-methyltransferase n=1 Tax=Methanobacterium aggregans TaxID=1615586 RepID=UPI001AE3F370|nr:fibrillarin-like rRNA/tRNA 2'-O-methyltransferase [Methanobacterium aggregans]MBP2046358.1 fibrillarin-like pre-rRNA processing protein [Methanobacterium aggregans]